MGSLKISVMGLYGKYSAADYIYYKPLNEQISMERSGRAAMDKYHRAHMLRLLWVFDQTFYISIHTWIFEMYYFFIVVITSESEYLSEYKTLYNRNT